MTVALTRCSGGPGRVRTWLREQAAQFRAGIELVVIDPSAPYASGIRVALPQARIAVDRWHLVRLANDMVTRYANASPERCTAAVAWHRIRCGRAGGCCSPPATACPASNYAAWIAS